MDFPLEKPSSYWDTPVAWETPISHAGLDVQHGNISWDEKSLCYLGLCPRRLTIPKSMAIFFVMPNLWNTNSHGFFVDHPPQAALAVKVHSWHQWWSWRQCGEFQTPTFHWTGKLKPHKELVSVRCDKPHHCRLVVTVTHEQHSSWYKKLLGKLCNLQSPKSP